MEWWIVDGVLSAEPVADAHTVFDGGWIVPGLVDAHCHVGLGVGGPVDLDECIAQAETERGVGALLLRDCGSPTDTRSLDDRHDLPRIIRHGRHLARPKRYQRGFAIELEDESQLPDAVAEQARWGDGWVKLVGDWIDRDTGDLAPLWSDDVLKAAMAAAHAEGARVTAHVFSEDALPGLINAGIDCIEHGTGLTDDTVELMVEHGTALVPTLINIENFPGIADGGREISGLCQAHARPLRPVPTADRRRARSGRADLRGHRRGQHGRARPHRRRDRRAEGDRHDPDRGAGGGELDRPRAGWAGRRWSTARPRTWCATPTTRGRARPSSTTQTWSCCAAGRTRAGRNPSRTG